MERWLSWLKALVLKTRKGETSSRVRIPLSPPIQKSTPVGAFFVAEREEIVWETISWDSKLLPDIL
jgi:hypothetical protein